MAIQVVTSPPLLDETGQEMVTKLEAIKNAVNNNAGQISYNNSASGLQATKVQGAIDEVKGITDNISSSLANYKEYTTLLDTTGTQLINTVQTFNLSQDFRNYLLLLIEYGDYNNTKGTLTMLSTRFDESTNSARPIIYMNDLSGAFISVYKNTTKSVNILANSNLDIKYKIRIRGLIKVNNYT